MDPPGLQGAFLDSSEYNLVEDCCRISDLFVSFRVVLFALAMMEIRASSPYRSVGLCVPDHKPGFEKAGLTGYLINRCIALAASELSLKSILFDSLFSFFAWIMLPFGTPLCARVLPRPLEHCG
jgi:hypothetical protein